jgi:branched-chain amino acid transport system ATP-binding protein
MPQGDALFPGLSVKENLDSGAFAAGWRERKKRRDRVLQLFPRLADRLDQSAGTLSGGERRMCSLGRGLMADARIFLIDEPSLGLAPGLAAGLFATLKELDLGDGTLILAEQNRTLLEGWIDRIVRMHGGRIVGIEPGDSTSEGGPAEGDGRAGA